LNKHNFEEFNNQFLTLERIEACKTESININLNDLKHIKPIQYQAMIGYGRETFEAASQFVLSGNLTNSLSWAEFIFDSMPAKVGDTLASVAKVYFLPIWACNPSRIIRYEYNLPYTQHTLTPVEAIHRDSGTLFREKNVQCYSRIAFETVHTNLLAGEEILQIKYMEDNTVWFEMQTCASLSIKMFQPLLFLVRPLQHLFLADHTHHIQRWHKPRQS
jgi:uncharacterized protein (UPF0548 family)